MVVATVTTLLLLAPVARAQLTIHPPRAEQRSLTPQPVFPDSWTHFGRTPARVSTAATRTSPIPPLIAPAFVVSRDHQSRPIIWLGPAGVVVHDGLVCGVGIIAGTEHAIACDRFTGGVLWAAPLPPIALDSWSTPAIDPINHTLLVAIDTQLFALDLDTGAQAWSVALNNPVVNASPLVTIDLAPADRAFITDSSFAGPGHGRLYCVNVDPFHASLNPYQPGQLVWSVALGGQTSGNTPAYAHKTVYTATAAGRVLAFDARSQTAPSPEWVFDNPHAAGFFGGVSVRAGFVYAASYGFASSQLNSNLVKLDAQTGALEWSAPSNRTDSTPIPLPGGRVALSAGLHPDPVFGDFGSRPSVAIYAGDGTLLIETALDTWIDTNSDSIIDTGEYTPLGGWTHLPIAAGNTLLVGTLPAPQPGGPFVDPYDRISVIDLSWQHGDDPAALVLDQFDGCGSTPALTAGWLYSIGPGGLHGFAP